MTEQEKQQRAKELSATLYSCFKSIEDAEAMKKEQLERMHELSIEFEQLDREWYRKFRDTLHPYKDPDWNVAQLEQECEELKKKIDSTQ